MSMFITYKVEVENQLKKNIKILKFDWGGEYESNKFSELCTKFDIIHQTTASYTPQQNKIAEQKNKTLKEMINSMLVSCKAPQNLGGSSVNYKLYSKQSAPQETWSYTMWVMAWKDIFLLLPQNVGVPLQRY